MVIAENGLWVLRTKGGEHEKNNFRCFASCHAHNAGFLPASLFTMLWILWPECSWSSRSDCGNGGGTGFRDSRSDSWHCCRCSGLRILWPSGCLCIPATCLCLPSPGIWALLRTAALSLLPVPLLRIPILRAKILWILQIMVLTVLRSGLYF